jgi:GT2 family glycosyltransferase
MILNDLWAYVSRKLDNRAITLQNYVDLNAHHTPKKTSAPARPKVSIVIPTRDKSDLLKRCIDSIRKFTTDTNFELIIVDNNSIENDTVCYLDVLRKQGITVLSYPKSFNYSAICNMAAEKATGEYLCFLNNDTEVLQPHWLSSMVDHASQPSVGLVGALLTFSDGRLQHMGVALGYTGVAGHPGRGEDPQSNLPEHCFQVSAITFACAVISAAKFKSLGGLDEEFPVAFNDVDIAIRATKSNFMNVVCIKAHLLHGESQTRSRPLSFGGLFQGMKDVLMLLKVHNHLLTENFFVRRILSDKLRKQGNSKSTQKHSRPQYKQ